MNLSYMNLSAISNEQAASSREKVQPAEDHSKSKKMSKTTKVALTIFALTLVVGSLILADHFTNNVASDAVLKFVKTDYSRFLNLGGNNIENSITITATALAACMTLLGVGKLIGKGVKSIKARQAKAEAQAQAKVEAQAEKIIKDRILDMTRCKKDADLLKLNSDPEFQPYMKELPLAREIAALLFYEKRGGELSQEENGLIDQNKALSEILKDIVEGFISPKSFISASDIVDDEDR